MRLRLLLLALLLLASTAFAKERVRTVYKGQRLGSIAKRYQISVSRLCERNGIDKEHPIHPGQKLFIPEKNWKPGGKSAGAQQNNKQVSKSKSKKKSKKSSSTKPRFHKVAKGHTLSAIAGRYAITVSALCTANGIQRDAQLSVGQKLIIPSKSDRDGSKTASLRKDGKLEEKAQKKTEQKSQSSAAQKAKKSWSPYVKPAWRRGYIEIKRYGRAWKGYVIDPNDKVLPLASKKINYVLGAKKNGPKIHPRLVRLLAQVSDTFGGRPVRIVSGYRTRSFVAASKHKDGRALDFSIPTIPNEALRDYLRTLKNVGVGYYPNSSFVHLDVRDYNAYWVDYAGPGEAPKKKGKGKGKAKAKAKKKPAQPKAKKPKVPSK